GRGAARAAGPCSARVLAGDPRLTLLSAAPSAGVADDPRAPRALAGGGRGIDGSDAEADVRERRKTVEHELRPGAGDRGRDRRLRRALPAAPVDGDALAPGAPPRPGRGAGVDGDPGRRGAPAEPPVLDDVEVDPLPLPRGPPAKRGAGPPQVFFPGRPAPP